MKVSDILKLDMMNGATLTNVLICFAVAVVLGIFIAVVYMNTTPTYSRNLIITIAVLPVIVQVVFMAVYDANIITTITLLGVFRLIRFRSVPGNSKEIMAVFLAATVGLAVGLGQLFYAILLTVIICVLFIIFNLISFGEKKGGDKLLKILIPENLDYTEVFDDIFDTYLKKAVSERVKSVNMGTMFEVSFIIRMKDPKQEKKFIDEIRTRNGNLSVTIGRVPVIVDGM